MLNTDIGERLEEHKKFRDGIARIVREVFKEGVHYGSAVGASLKDGEKASMLKVGAEVGLQILGVATDVEVKVNYGDGKETPPVDVVARAKAHVGSLAGDVIAVGNGGASSWEKKFRRRKGKTQHNCGGNAIPDKYKPGNFYCFTCKGSVPAGEVTSGEAAENPDPHDLLNNLIKFAAKRAIVDLALRMGFSEFFTQDREDQEREIADVSGKPSPEKPAEGPPTATGAPSTVAELGEALTGDPDRDIGIVAAVLAGMTPGKKPEDFIKAASAFQGKDGKEVFFTNPAGKSPKWQQSTLGRLKKWHGQKVAQSHAGDEPSF